VIVGSKMRKEIALREVCHYIKAWSEFQVAPPGLYRTYTIAVKVRAVMTWNIILDLVIVV
jgi:hypothetical protein